MGRKGYKNKKEASNQEGLPVKHRPLKKKPKHQGDPFNTPAILKALREEANPNKKPGRNVLLRARKRLEKAEAGKSKAAKEPEDIDKDMEVLSSDDQQDPFKQNFPYADEDNMLDEDDFLPNEDNFDALAGSESEEEENEQEEAEDKDEASEESDELEGKNGCKDGGALIDYGDAQNDAELSNTLSHIKSTNQLIALPSGEFIRAPMSASANRQDMALVMDERIRSLFKLISGSGKGSSGQNGQVSRKALRVELLDLLCSRYSYCTFLMHKFIDLFPHDIMEFIEANETDRPLTIRTNTLKTRRKDLVQALTSRGMNLSLEGLNWTRVGVVVDATSVPPGATPEYLAGYYALQGVSSFLPVMALDPRPDEKVLDLCAAPGMKTTYIGQMMKNSGVLVANDSQADRCKAIVGNLHRMGISNAIVCNQDGRQFSRLMHNFHRVLVDAPCSGTGIIAKDPSVKTSRCDARDIQRTVEMQKKLLKEAIACCNIGGVIVYSTCSILIEENEHVANYVLKKGLVEVMDLPPSIPGEEGFVNFKGLHFHKDLKKAKRVYPHRHNMDGFFLVKFKRIK